MRRKQRPFQVVTKLGDKTIKCKQILVTKRYQAGDKTVTLP